MWAFFKKIDYSLTLKISLIKWLQLLKKTLDSNTKKL
jgi:hypothetical protein